MYHKWILVPQCGTINRAMVQLHPRGARVHAKQFARREIDNGDESWYARDVREAGGDDGIGSEGDAASFPGDGEEALATQAMISAIYRTATEERPIHLQYSGKE